MKSAPKMKTSWTWEEWMASRPARQALARSIGPAVIRRKRSSSDRRLKALFDGRRAPRENPPNES